MMNPNRSVFDDVEPVDMPDSSPERVGLLSEQVAVEAATAARAVASHLRGKATNAARRAHTAASAGSDALRRTTLPADARLGARRRRLRVAAASVIALAGLVAWRPWEATTLRPALAVPSVGILPTTTEPSADTRIAGAGEVAQQTRVAPVSDFSAMAALPAVATAPAQVDAVPPEASPRLSVRAEKNRVSRSEQAAAPPAKVPDTNSVLEAADRADRSAHVAANTRATARDAHRRAGASARGEAPTVRNALPAPAVAATCTLRGSVADAKGAALAAARVYIVGLGRSSLARNVETDSAGGFATELPRGSRVRVSVRARGHREAIVETDSCSALPTLLLKRGNPLTSLFDAARRTNRKIGDAVHGD